MEAKLWPSEMAFSVLLAVAEPPSAWGRDMRAGTVMAQQSHLNAARAI
jgi:hypothetical protein